MSIVNTSTGAWFDRSIAELASQRGRAERLQGQLATDERLARASDDPAAAARLRALARADARAETEAATAGRAAADLGLADIALASVADAVIRARELATQAAGGTLSAEQRAAIGTELAAIHDQLFDLANSADAAGHALFGGTAAGPAYTRDAAGNAVYTGNGDAGELPIPNGQAIGRGLTGPQVFAAGGTDLLGAVKTLADALRSGSGDPAAAARDGVVALSAGLDGLITAQAVVGARLAVIDRAADSAARTGEARAAEQAEIGGTDFAGTVARLQQTMLTLEASQASFSRLSSLSLFALLR